MGEPAEIPLSEQEGVSPSSPTATSEKSGDKAPHVLWYQRPWHYPFTASESAMERLSETLKAWAFLDVLDRLGRLSILIAVVAWVSTLSERQTQARAALAAQESAAVSQRAAAESQRRAEIFQAWQMVDTSHGMSGSGGRVEAVQLLAAQHEDLDGIDLSHADLPRLQLSHSRVTYANFSDAHMWSPNFAGALFANSNLHGAAIHSDFRRKSIDDTAPLSDADLREQLNKGDFANLLQWDCSGCDLSESRISTALMQGSTLSEATAKNAHWSRVTLDGATIKNADFTKSVLDIVFFKKADLRGLRLIDVKCYTCDFSGADLSGADLTRIRIGGPTGKANSEYWQFNRTNLAGIRGVEPDVLEIIIRTRGAVDIADHDAFVAVRDNDDAYLKWRHDWESRHPQTVTNGRSTGVQTAKPHDHR